MKNFFIREAQKKDFLFIAELMDDALGKYYDGDHYAHAERIFNTHIRGGKDENGFFSIEQKMFVVDVDGVLAGIIHLVGKSQGTYKISPLIVHPRFKNHGLGSILLKYAEKYVCGKGARQIYCTVARENINAFSFFLKKGFVIAGKSEHHYKDDITEVMLYKSFDFKKVITKVEILEFTDSIDVRLEASNFLLNKLPQFFGSVDEKWVENLFSGHERRFTKDVNKKYKIIFVAFEEGKVVGVVGATPKKGEPIKIMPFAASNENVFEALLKSIARRLINYGHKLYIHLCPSAKETIVLQKNNWKLDAVLPEAYHLDVVTQQWSLDLKK